MLFSRHNLRWGSPSRPITFQTILNEMTMEQVELLSTKCLKQDVKQADLAMAATRAVLEAALGGKFLTPSDRMDIQLGYEVDTGDGEPVIVDGDGKALTPTQLRDKVYGRWKMPDVDLIQWLTDRTQSERSAEYALDRYFTQVELDQHGICLLKE